MSKVFIDAGHGGSDSGAVGHGLQEKHVVMKIARYMRSYLLDNYTGVTVNMSRTTDTFLSLSARANKANQWGADAFVSIHINAGGGVGYEDFIYNGPVSSKTRDLQNKMNAELSKHFTSNRGKKRANFAVLRQTHMSAVLTENGFIDNKRDADFLKSESNLRKLGESHAIGVANFLNLSRKTGTSSTSTTRSSRSSAPSPSDNNKWRLRTGTFKTAKDLSNAIEQLEEKYSWLIYEKAESTDLNPDYRIVTGTFTGRNVAQYYADQLSKEFGWVVYVVAA